MNNSLQRMVVSGLATVLLSAGNSSCKRSTASNSAESTSETPAAPSSPQPTPRNAFERDLQYVRNGQFTYIWVFSRKDVRPLDKDDGDYLRKNAPQVVDWVTTDEGRKVIAGTNFDLEKGNLELLKKRFKVEDYSNK